MVEYSIINESGLYSLVMSSNLSDAKKCKRWVTFEALPEIRHTGAYEIKNIEETVSKVIEENLETIIFKTVKKAVKENITEVLSESAKTLIPCFEMLDRKLSEMTRFFCNNKYNKLLKISLKLRVQDNKMIISGKYSCQQII